MICSPGLYAFDQALLRRSGQDWILGVDEAGRGPLAGPVVACAVRSLEHPCPELDGIQDSKQLSPERRELFFERIRELGLAFEIGWAVPSEIDRLNILQATLLAMRRAVLKHGRLSRCLVVVDGNQPISGLSRPQQAVVRADSKSLAVCCAGVAAKVIRDRWMGYWEQVYPGYGFSRHKGYGSQDHMEALAKLGPSPIHRRSFSPVAQLKLI